MAETNLWDSLEVEMTAQFDKTLITLGNLKSIEENAVVNIASVYDNNVTLSVEGKAVAGIYTYDIATTKKRQTDRGFHIFRKTITAQR